MIDNRKLVYALEEIALAKEHLLRAQKDYSPKINAFEGINEALNELVSAQEIIEGLTEEEEDDS